MEKIIMSIALSLAAAGVHAETVNFDQDKTGALPAGWVSGVTGGGKPHWLVEVDKTAPSGIQVLKQSGSGDF